MDQDNALQQWMNRAAAFELLGMAFLVPTKTLAEALVEGEYGAACVEVAQALGCDSDAIAAIGKNLEEYEGADAEETFHALRHEHTRLFLGERKPLVTPYMGIWDAQNRGKQGLLFVEKKTVEIEHFMHRCGVYKNLEQGQSNDPLDHVGTMCEFLQILCLVKAEAVVPAEGANVADDDFEVFMRSYFAPYATWCAGRVAEETKTAFYQAMAAFLGMVATLA